MKSVVHVRVPVQVPTVPNYLRIVDRHGRTDGTLINVGDLTDNELRELGMKWTEDLLENARKQRNVEPCHTGSVD